MPHQHSLGNIEHILRSHHSGRLYLLREFYFGSGDCSCGVAVALLWMLPSLSFKTIFTDPRKAHFMKTLLLSFLSFFFVNMLIAA